MSWLRAAAAPRAGALAAVLGLAAVAAAGCAADGAEPGPSTTGRSTTSAGPPRPTSALAPTTAPTPTTRRPPTPASPAEVRAPRSARAVADVLGSVEPGLRALPLGDPRAAALGWRQDRAYLALRAHPEWLPTVLGALPDDVRAVVAANILAAESLRGLAEPRPELPAWRIRAPRPVAELVGYYRDAEAASGVPWQYLAAIHLVETRMGRIVGTSTAGAQGPMQFIPETWAAYGEGDVYDDRDAILAAGRYLAASGAPADMADALFAYNHSDRYVAAVSAYARLLTADERAYNGYYHWQVHYTTTAGLHLLPESFPDAPAVRLDP